MQYTVTPLGFWYMIIIVKKLKYIASIASYMYYVHCSLLVATDSQVTYS